MDSTLVKSSGLSPVKKKRSKTFLEYSEKIKIFSIFMINFCLDRIIPALALVIKKHKDHFSNVVTQLGF